MSHVDKRLFLLANVNNGACRRKQVLSLERLVGAVNLLTPEVVILSEQGGYRGYSSWALSAVVETGWVEGELVAQ